MTSGLEQRTEPTSAADTAWLTEAETEAWKALISVILRLPPALDAQLQCDVGLSLFDYLVLSALSMAENRTVRMSELARLTNASPSRLSNVVSRHERRGWVQRSPDPTDGRFINATLTPEGWDLVQRAAPGHVEQVRALVFAPLTKAHVGALETIGRRIVREVESSTTPGKSATC